MACTSWELIMKPTCSLGHSQPADLTSSHSVQATGGAGPGGAGSVCCPPEGPPRPQTTLGPLHGWGAESWRCRSLRAKQHRIDWFRKQKSHRLGHALAVVGLRSPARPPSVLALSRPLQVLSHGQAPGPRCHLPSSPPGEGTEGCSGS